MYRRYRRAFLAMLVVEVNQDVAVYSVTRKQDQHDEIRNEQRKIEAVGVIQATKRGVKKMLADIGTYASRANPHRQRRSQNEIREGQAVQ